MVNSRNRLEGWEPRLARLVYECKFKPYVLGEHDCFRLACRVIEALTGVDRWPEFRGYSSKREALVKLAAYGSSFEAAGDRFFGTERIPVAQAQRGDILALQDDAGEKHLAVLIGHRAACMLATGLTYVDAARCHCAWRVG